MHDSINGIFRGELTDLYVLSKAITLQDMIQFTSWDCKTFVLNTTLARHNAQYSSLSFLIDWRKLNITEEGSNIKHIQLSLDEVCRDNDEEVVKVFIIKLDHQVENS